MAVEGTLFGFVAVWARRRFGADGLVVATAALALAFAVAGASAPVFASFVDARRLPVAGGIVGAMASAWAVHVFISHNPEPDLFPEAALGAVVFMVGFLVGLVLVAMTLVRIG